MTDPLPAGAIFLSYAREDSDAARRIADALRAFGLEVWFDQSELRGGDAWDQKIRKQIRECALFIPIISATTQNRGEGYFRREWKMGVDRTHDMAAGLSFIMPVVIDSTTEGEAAVPEEFMRYQWSRLPHGVPSSQFVDQVKSLLAAPRKAAPAARPPVPLLAAAGGPVAVPRRRLPLFLGIAAVAVIAALAFLVLRPKVAAPAAPSPAAAAPAVPMADAGTGANAQLGAKSIAVLPFENISEDKDNNAFFSDGIHEDILTNLALVKELRVVSRTSVMQYRDTTKPIRRIAKELGVAYILEGSVRRVGNKVRVTGQLIRADSDEHVWAKAYDRDLTDIFAIQAELAQAIAASMRAAISPAEQTLLERRPTDNTAAYDLYLKARRLDENYAPSAEIEADLRSAVALDPKFALAWAQLGSILAFSYFDGEDTTDARRDKAKEAAETARRLAPDDPGVLERVADFHYYAYRDYDLAAEQYLRLQKLRPNDAGPVYSIALIRRRQGKHQEALDAFHRMIELDSFDLHQAREFVQYLLGLRRYDECEAVGGQMVKRFPGRAIFPEYVALAQFSRDGSTAGLDAFARASFAPDDKDVFLWSLKINARARGDFQEAVRLDREHPYLDTAVPHFMQDVETAYDLREAGDPVASRTLAGSAIQVMKTELQRQPENLNLLNSQTIACVLVGEKAEALRFADKTLALLPEERDAVDGPANALIRVTALAESGDKEQALAELSRLLHSAWTPSVYVVRNGLWFGFSVRALRGDKRLEAILDDPKNNRPIY